MISVCLNLSIWKCEHVIRPDHCATELERSEGLSPGLGPDKVCCQVTAVGILWTRYWQLWSKSGGQACHLRTG